jgi:hypothetical protein
MASPQVKISHKPRFWATACTALAVAVALGLALQHVLQTRLDAIQALATHDVIRARTELAGIFRIIAVGVFGSTTALGAAIFAASRRAIREERFPPSGTWSWRSARVVAGPRALALARAMTALAVALVVLSIAAGALTWYMASVLLACRAI